MTDDKPREAEPTDAAEIEETESDDAADLGAAFAGDIYTMIQKERAAETDSYRRYASNPRYVDHLRQALQAFRTQPEIAPGALVQWKTFLKGAPFPEYGAPAIVVEVLEHPRLKDEDGDPLAHPVDVFIGFLDGAQELRIIGTDSRRLAPWDVG